MCILLVSSSFAFDDVFNAFRRILKVYSDLTFHYLTFPFLTFSNVSSRYTIFYTTSQYLTFPFLTFSNVSSRCTQTPRPTLPQVYTDPSSHYLSFPFLTFSIVLSRCT